MTKTLGYARLLCGLLGFSSIIIELATLSERHVLNIANFFSFFTILSNAAACIFLILYSRPSDGRHSQYIRGAITLYMLMTGIIFSLLLAGLKNVDLTAVPWDNIVLHYIMPIVVVLDWLVAPPKIKLALRRSFLWLVIPVLYVGYSLVRGAITGWYPYPFLNAKLHSYGEIALTSVILFIGVIVATWLLVFYSNWWRKE